MKKLIIVFLVLCLSMTVVAQNQIKRVAILETVDKEGTVSYMKLLQFRSNLTTAITNTEGYEGYDRADLEQIIGEHNFQRTGLVSDADIKKIGEFTGAQYVLIAEAAIDGSNMFITAKIIDVETARILRNSNQLMGTSAAEMQEGSQKVAADLLGVQFNKNENFQTVSGKYNKYKGYTKDYSKGLYYQFFGDIHDTAAMPKTGDLVGVLFSLRASESILIPMGSNEMLMDSLYDGDIYTALRMMHVGDSASFILDGKKFFKHFMQDTVYQFGNDPLYFDVKLYGRMPAAQFHRLCDYNTALKQLLDYDYSGCQNTLDCITQKDAKTYYLAAVLAARTKNEEQLYANLSEAVKLDSSFKLTAKKDSEFMRYRHSERFKQIVQ